MSWLWLLPIFIVSPFVMIVLLLQVLSLYWKRRKNLLPVAPLRVPLSSGRQIAVYEVGTDETRPTLLFLHGSPASGSAFTEQMKHHFPGWRLVTVDRLGYGHSDGSSLDASLLAQSDSINELICQRNYQRLVVVGHSYGAPIAVSVALRHPHVRGVVLIGGCFDPAYEKPWMIQYWAASPLLSWSLPRAIRQCNLELLRLKPELQNLSDRLPSLSCPVFMIHGDQDDRVPVGNVTFLAHRLQDLGKEGLFSQTIYSQSDHFLPWRQAERINRDLTQFLNSLARD